MSQDRIADMLTNIKNSYLVRKKEVVIPWSPVNYAVAKVLLSESYIQKASKRKRKNGYGEEILVGLRYSGGRTIWKNVRRISKPGRRVYAVVGDLVNYNRRLGIAIISTPQGVMTTKMAAKKNLGGELICRVW